MELNCVWWIPPQSIERNAIFIKQAANLQSTVAFPEVFGTISDGYGELTMILRMHIAAVAAACFFLSGCAEPAHVDIGASGLLSANLQKIQTVARSFRVDTNALTQSVSNITDPVQKAEAQDAIGGAIDEKFAQTLAGCQPAFTGYEHQAQTLKWISFGIAMVGTVAGSIVVPALSAATTVNKAAIAAVGGLSGAANSAQSVLNSNGLTASAELATRTTVQQQFTSALNDYFAARGKNDPTASLVALQKAQASCVAYAVQTGSAIITTGK